MYQVIACTGEMATCLGRPRAVTPHRWMVAEPLVEILVSYRRGDAYWLEIVPLRPGRRVLTSYVLRAWNARTSPRRLIYDHQRGRLSDRPYLLFETPDLVYRLPCRNWAWRSIRRGRHPGKGEEAHYEGFDATARRPRRPPESRLSARPAGPRMRLFAPGSVCTSGGGPGLQNRGKPRRKARPGRSLRSSYGFCLSPACSRPAAGPRRAGFFLFHGGVRRWGRSGKAARPGRVPPFRPGALDASACFPLVCSACPGCPARPWDPGPCPPGRPSGPGRQRRPACCCDTL
jgi:hypothetical protein